MKTKKLKATLGWNNQGDTQRNAIDKNIQMNNVIYSIWWFLPQLVVILLTVGTGVLCYDRFPESIAMHYDLAGNITRAVEKSYQAVLWPVAAQASMILVTVFGLFAITKGRLQIDASNPEESLQQNVIFRRRWSGFIYTLGFLMTVMFYLFQLELLLNWSPNTTGYTILTLTAFILIYAIWLSISMGQGGGRIQTPGKKSPTKQASFEGDQHWKLGRFYFNRQDPALFVEKRFGVGWTINMGQPLSWLILMGIIVLPIILIMVVAP